MLRKNIRFNAQSRKDLAHHVASARIQERKANYDLEEPKLAKAIWTIVWAEFDGTIDPYKLTNGLVPYIDYIFVPSVNGWAGTNLELHAEYPIPDCQKNYEWDAIKDGNPDLVKQVRAHIKGKEDLVEEYRETVSKLCDYFDKFSAPKHLLEESPQFENYFPEHWMEEGTDPVSIDAILEAA